MKERFKLTALERSWILYDVGNSAFILLVSTLIPIYFDALAAAGGVSENNYLAYWGYAGSISTLLVAIIGPICGTMADQKGFKKPIFLLSLLLGAIGCAALGAAWSWLAFLVIFIIAKVGYFPDLSKLFDVCRGSAFIAHPEWFPCVNRFCRLRVVG